MAKSYTRSEILKIVSKGIDDMWTDIYTRYDVATGDFQRYGDLKELEDGLCDLIIDSMTENGAPPSA